MGYTNRERLNKGNSSKYPNNKRSSKKNSGGRSNKAPPFLLFIINSIFIVVIINTVFRNITVINTNNIININL